MKKAEYKQIDTETIERIRYIENEDGTVTEETYTEEIPIMGMVYREMTAEEIAEMEAMPKPNILPTETERLEAIESAMLELIAMTLGGDIDG